MDLILKKGAAWKDSPFFFLSKGKGKKLAHSQFCLYLAAKILAWFEV